MKLSVNHSQALISGLTAGSLHVDAIEWVPALPPQAIREAREILPEMPFHFHQGRMRFDQPGYQALREYIQLCPQSPWVSIHLAPLPALITIPALRWKLFLPQPSPTGSIRRFIQQVKKLQLRFKRPVILENMPALHPRKYRFESEPETIWQVQEATGCKLLLDLAHARIAAEARRMDVHAYIKALPLEHVVQMHLAGTRRDERSGRLFDAHQPLSREDYELLDWTLARAAPEWITLEYFREDPAALSDQLQRLAALIQP